MFLQEHFDDSPFFFRWNPDLSTRKPRSG